MAGLIEFYCRSNETSHASQFKWLDNTFKLNTDPHPDLIRIQGSDDQKLKNLRLKKKFKFFFSIG
jgi:hypothetical protein